MIHRMIHRAKIIVWATIVVGACIFIFRPEKLYTVPLVPRELFFEDEEYESPSITLDGTYIAYIAPYNGVSNIWIAPTSKPSDARAITNDTGRGIHTYRWGHDNKAIFYMQNNNGDENWNIYRVDLETGTTTNLTPFPGVQASILRYSKKFPDQMLITMNKEDKRLRDIYQLNTVSGALNLVAKNPGNCVGRMADSNLQVRILLLQQDDGSVTMVHRAHNDAPWDTLLTFGPEIVAQSAACVGFDALSESIYCVEASETDKACLVKIDTVTKQKTVMASDDMYDISPVLVQHPQTKLPVFTAIQRAEHEIIVLDDLYTQDISFLKKYKSASVNVVSYDDSFNLWIVRFSRSDLPSEYYLYDRQNKQIKFLFSGRPKLAQYTLAKTEPFVFKARDGLIIHGYITYPTTKTFRKNLPIVLFPHGGPHLRDRMLYFDPIVQLLANRGYVCVQINYRGSIGYGKAFAAAGYKEWGRGMQHDLTDGVAWLIQQGIADAKRVAILGGSYGGYAALVGAAFTPDIYCCAISLCGISSLTTFIQSIPPYWKPLLAKLNVQLGSLESDKAMLEERSPLYHVENIRIPILIAQGANDPRVKQAESEQIVTALKARGIPCEYLLFENEGHGLAYPANRLKFYGFVEQFLKQHFGSC